MKRKLPPKVSGRRPKHERSTQKEEREKITAALKRRGDDGPHGGFRKKKGK